MGFQEYVLLRSATAQRSAEDKILLKITWEALRASDKEPWLFELQQVSQNEPVGTPARHGVVRIFCSHSSGVFGPKLKP